MVTVLGVFVFMYVVVGNLNVSALMTNVCVL